MSATAVSNTQACLVTPCPVGLQKVLCEVLQKIETSDNGDPYSRDTYPPLIKPHGPNPICSYAVHFTSHTAPSFASGTYAVFDHLREPFTSLQYRHLKYLSDKPWLHALAQSAIEDA